MHAIKGGGNPVLIISSALVGLILVVGLYVWMVRPSRQATLVEQPMTVSAAKPVAFDLDLDCSGLNSYLRLDIEGANLLTQAASKSDANQAALRIQGNPALIWVTQRDALGAADPAPYRKLGPRAKDVVFELRAGTLHGLTIASDSDFVLERARVTCYRKPPPR